MVLVEVVQLVVDVDWAINLVLCNVEINLTSLWVTVLIDLSELGMAILVVPGLELDNLIAHDVEHDSDGEEDDTEDTESKHSAHSSWNWSPSGESLLLELGLLKLFNLFTDSLLLVC